MSSADAVWATSGSSSIEGVAAAVRGAGGARRSMGAARSDAAGERSSPMKKTGLIMESRQIIAELKFKQVSVFSGGRTRLVPFELAHDDARKCPTSFYIRKEDR
jgi:hypothetical protein